MKIPSQYHQFAEESAMIIVSGSDAVKIYLAKNNVFELISQHREPIPKYPDREGFFIQSGPFKHNLGGSGSVYEPHKIELQNRLQKYIKRDVTKILQNHEIETIYLLAPGYYFNKVEAAIPPSWQKHIRTRIRGNYVGNKEEKILKKINDYFEKTIGQKVPVSTEARKIIRKK